MALGFASMDRKAVFLKDELTPRSLSEDFALTVKSSLSSFSRPESSKISVSSGISELG